MEDKINHLEDLLIRLEDRSLRPGVVLPKGVLSNSKLTIAHVAREEINSLNEEDYIPAFQQLLSKEKVTINKINLITYLIRLANRFDRNDIADYVLELVGKEKTRWVNDVSLSGLNQSNLVIEKEQEILFDLAKHKDWQIRFNALGLLSKLSESYHQRVEDLCLGQIQTYKSKPNSLGVLASTLSKVGTGKSIPALKEIVSASKKSEAILSGINAIFKINGTNELDFFIECYKEKRDSFVKRNLIKLIAISGDENQKDLMVKRLKSLLSKKRTSNWHYTAGTEPELVTIFKFLDKNAIAESEKMLKWIAQKKMDFLDQTELTWIKERIEKG